VSQTKIAKKFTKNPYFAVQGRSRSWTLVLPEANTRSQQYLPVQLSRVKIHNSYRNALPCHGTSQLLPCCLISSPIKHINCFIVTQRQHHWRAYKHTALFI